MSLEKRIKELEYALEGVIEESDISKFLDKMSKIK